MSERQKGICISWLGKHGWIRDPKARRTYIVFPKDIPPNEGGERRMWPDEEIEFTAGSDEGKKNVAKGIVFLTRVPWFPMQNVEGTIKDWRGDFGFVAHSEIGSFFFHTTSIVRETPGPLIDPYAGQTAVFDTALDRGGRTRAVNVRLK